MTEEEEYTLRTHPKIKKEFWPFSFIKAPKTAMKLMASENNYNFHFTGIRIWPFTFYIGTLHTWIKKDNE